MKKLVYFVAILFLLTVSFSAYAKPPKHPFFRIPLKKWWESPVISSKLNLTEKEKNALNKLFVDTKEKLIDLKANIQKAHLKLREMLESEKIDEKKIIDQFDLLQKARSELEKARFLYVLEIRKILGFERFMLLKKLMKQKRYMHRRKHFDKHKHMK
ncbi:MAG: hypothetical protein DRG27_04420 [Deltaproteobacteria bacterium]|nr:MAG: hypothetical protein DRG27_04420 [Deltaproteobacteria bacterium]